MKYSKTVSEFLKELAKVNAFQCKYTESSMKMLSVSELRDFESYLLFGASIGLDAQFMARSYDRLVKDALREQLFFMKNGAYRYSTFDEVFGAVYFNDEYMRRYMMGLALTLFLWPNHLQMKRYFKKVIPTGRAGRYLEVGPGHGYYMMLAMLRGSFDTYTGVDISPASVSMTRSILGSDHFSVKSEWDIAQADFLDFEPNEPYDAFVMGEVLEHVEAPKALLNQVPKVVSEDAFIFVTTCINSPAIDHIYLFRTWYEIEELVTQTNMTVSEKLMLPYPGKTLSQCFADNLPVNVAMILRKER